MLRLALMLSAAIALPVQASTTHSFCWVGENGYRIEGHIAYPPDLSDRILTEADVTDFRILGFEGDRYIGGWTLEDLTPETSWTLRFDPRNLSFPMGGYRANGTYQEWNANGFADDCGDPGFGFNGGNRAQDVCLNGVFIEESGIDPDTPLSISPDPSNPCGPIPMSSLPVMRRHG